MKPRRYPPIAIKDLRGIRRRPPVWWGKDCPSCGRPELVDVDATVKDRRAAISFCINPRCKKVDKASVLSSPQ